jgi:hypothetical protein
MDASRKDTLIMLLLTGLREFNPNTQKFRISVPDEEGAKRMIAEIDGLGLLKGGAFDIETREYLDGWCVRISWRKLRGATQFYCADRLPNQRWVYQLNEEPIAQRVYITDDVAKAFGLA